MTIPTVDDGQLIQAAWGNSVADAINANDAYARGVMGNRPVTIIIDQPNITGIVDLAGFTMTFTVVQNRWYKVSWLLTTMQVSAPGQQLLYVSFDGNEKVVGNNMPVAVGANVTYGGSAYFGGGLTQFNNPNVAPGTRTIKMRAAVTAGTMTVANIGANNGRFAVEDIGAAP